MAEPMIQIKKPDGTFTKVPLSEFKKMQAKPAPSPVAALAPAPVAEVKEVKKEMEEKVELPQIKPESEIEKPKAETPHAHRAHVAHTVLKHPVEIKKHTPAHHATHAHKKLTREDAKSPLEEKMPVKTDAPMVSAKRENQVEEVIRKIGFGVAPDLQGRLKSLILARLKDIKSEDEIRDILLRPVKNSGLGLSEGQVEKIIKLCREVLGADAAKAASDNAQTPILKGKSGGMALMVEPPELPMVIPVKSSFSVKNSTPPAPLNKFATDTIVSRIIKENMADEPMFKISNKPAVRQVVQDISVPDMEMGPVEEFKSITITEFRRLSSNPEEAAKRLYQKMSNLQEESFVWYLDAVAAYHNSPLYLEYMSAVSQSLAERKSLANVLAAKNGIKLNEVMAIIEMEKTL
ncbi:MAG: hypothetical protein HYT15_01540 [Candidatus Magasanikbacteria bacterium]|nr:hypothetical protein [Candidatus Magasanikbacteria bacterium]